MGALILVIANVTYPILSDNNFGETKPSSFFLVQYLYVKI